MAGPNPRSIPVVGIVTSLLLLGCASVPAGRSAVDHVDIRSDAKALDADDVQEKMSTAPSPRFLGLFEGVVYDYEIFDRFVFQRDLARVERYYRARGFYEAHARAGRLLETSAKHVQVQVFVEEGLPVLIGGVNYDGLDGLPKIVADAARAAGASKLKEGDRFEEDNYAAAEDAIRTALQNEAYAYVQVTRRAAVSILRHRADVVFTIVPDQPATLGPIVIEGLGSLPDAAVRRALNLTEGEPYSASELESAQQAALDLGVFASVAMLPQLDHPPPASHVVPIIVRVEPSRLRTIKIGGGIELDAIKAELHASVGWENRNFLGGLRKFSVQFTPGLVLYPTRIDNLSVPTDLLPEEKLRFELRQPGLFEARTSGFIRPEFNIFPLLLRAAKSTDANAPVPGYREILVRGGLDRSFLRFFYASLTQNVQIENPFTYKGALDPNITTIFISYPALLTTLDFRDDKIHPHKGIFIGNEIQVAGTGGQAMDIRVQPEIRTYVPVSKRITLASRATVGFLFPGNYGSHIDPTNGGPAAGASTADWAHDLQLIYFRGFFSGGPSSNRGYALRDVGPHGVVPFYNPGLDARQYAASCDPGTPTFDASRCAVPLGGLTLWEASTELRFPLVGQLSAATFCDTSDVSPQRAQIRLARLHLSCGLGARYETPVGPIRLDVGYRIIETLEGSNRSAADKIEEGVHPTLFGAPIAIAFGIGEAF